MTQCAGSGFMSSARKMSAKSCEVRELLLRLAHVEARRLEGTCGVERLPAVDAGGLAVERLREDEAQDLAVGGVVRSNRASPKS